MLAGLSAKLGGQTFEVGVLGLLIRGLGFPLDLLAAGLRDDHLIATNQQHEGQTGEIGVGSVHAHGFGRSVRGEEWEHGCLERQAARLDTGGAWGRRASRADLRGVCSLLHAARVKAGFRLTYYFCLWITLPPKYFPKNREIVLSHYCNVARNRDT